MKVHLTIWDQQGNQLFHGQVPSCFDSLRPDDAFWIGEPQARQWVKVVRMTYGVCTKDGSIHLEMVVESSEQKPTRVTRPAPQIIDHGQFELDKGVGGKITFPKGSWFSVDCGQAGGGCVEHLTIRYKDSNGKEDAKSFTRVASGESRFLRTGAFTLTVAVLQAMGSDHSFHPKNILLQITEERKT